MSDEFLRMEGVPEGTPSPALPATPIVPGVDLPDDDEPAATDWESFAGPTPLPRGVAPKSKQCRLTLPELMPPTEVSPQRRLLILDTW